MTTHMLACAISELLSESVLVSYFYNPLTLGDTYEIRLAHTTYRVPLSADSHPADVISNFRQSYPELFL